MIAPFLGQSISDKINVESPIESNQTAAPLAGDRLDKPLYTGRFLLNLKDNKMNYRQLINQFSNKMGARTASSSDFDTTYSEEDIADADVYIYEELGIALIGAPQEAAMQFQEEVGGASFLEPELVVYSPPFFAAEDIITLAANSTWGINTSKIDRSSYSGNKIKVAVLDTGLDLNHPDFMGRNITTQSFVPNVSVQDVLGHGTHCIGTACGRTDASGMRYGVAGNSDIYVGKVLGNDGRGAQGWIINGMTWAANAGCKVISMSLGSAAFAGLPHSAAYESAAANAVSKGCVIIAAAGNDSNRNGNRINPVASPANCPSIMAIGALGTSNVANANFTNLFVANFSNRTINPGQNLDISAAGVNVYSSWPMPSRYKTISGTSMATPHVAGIAALLWEQNPTFTPAQITVLITNLAQKLPHLPTVDVGAGLSVAP